MRRAAKILRVHRTTVARKKKFLALECGLRLNKTAKKNLDFIQFDELETSEHSKCKPLSVYIAVNPLNRKILAFEIARFPAKGRLAKRARKKYGLRADERRNARGEFLTNLIDFTIPTVEIMTDMSPHYPNDIRKFFPLGTHITTKGQRGCVTGQGELKRGGFDPLFSLNHTFAMFRANMNRLFRRTWCTTKNVQGLREHLLIYIDYHNRVLTL